MSTANPKQYSRRCFLRYVGATAAAGVASNHLLGPLTAAASDAAPRSGGWTRPDGTPAWTPVPYPVPMPGDGGDGATDAKRLATYVVRDELVLPQGFKSSILVQWGDRLGAPGHEIVFGYNADYTGLVPIDGSRNEYWLIVNHEYISGRPWLQGYASVHGDSPVDAKGRLGGIPLMGSQLLLKDFLPIARPDVRDAIRKLCSTAMADLGLSILRVRRRDDGVFDVVKDASDHFRFCGASSQNVPEGTMSFTGPAAPLLGKPRGTFSNCSGATTPWGTFLTCEENVQDQVMEFITPTGQPLPGGFKRLAGMGEDSPTNLPFEFEGLGTGLEEPLDGRQYGWVCEIDPVKRTLKKHTTLGRFRHENVALRVEKGKRLAAYMGDDRRGGHIWKFVSSDVVNDPKDPSNSLLLERGTLYVARIDADMTGRWIPLEQGTPLRLPEPEQCATGHVWLPRRPEGGHVAVGTEAAGKEMTLEQWVKSAEAFGLRPFSELTLVDLVYPMPRDFRGGQRPFGQPTLVMDAYVMANAVGGTPCARPEDVEVHPTDNSIYIAFTDSTGSDDGSPDKRIFPDSAGKNSRQYGAIYRLVEDGDDPAALTFTWGKFVSAGEAAEQGGGFACADNLAFDPDGNLWMVTDITTPSHNFPVDRTEATKTNPGGSRFPGLFGNNALFMIPTRGPSAGVPFCFAIGPMECEMTGPTFTDDGRTLILAIQHPGELNGTRGMPGVDQPLDVPRDMKLAARDGSLFTQKRTVPLGSNFPSREPGVVPRPCVVCITRA